MPSQFSTEVRIRFSECDPMGYAHHSAYVVWFELARVEMLREWGTPHAQFAKGEAALVVSELHLRYRAPARYDDMLRLTARVGRLTPARVIVEQQAFVGSRLVCEATATIACVRADGNPRRVPESLHHAALAALGTAG
jgi:acyl-CoA thioester hydrolase